MDRHAESASQTAIEAGSRPGKTATVLKPSLLRYRGPCIVIDPKGELSSAIAQHRGQFGPVHILDPFEEKDIV